eukprot:470526-Amphidinium_carterae.1
MREYCSKFGTCEDREIWVTGLPAQVLARETGYAIACATSVVRCSVFVGFVPFLINPRGDS